MLKKLDTASLKQFFSNKTNAILIFGLLIVVILAIIGVRWFISSQTEELPLEEIDITFDPNGAYALLLPRRDGNAINLNIFRVASYGAFSYQLTYQSVGSTADENIEGLGAVDRGAGDLKSFVELNKKTQFSQEILFGTCSKGNTSDLTHCVFDKNVENGDLSLGMKQENKVYISKTTWHMQKPDVALGVITSADNHFTYKTTASRTELANVGYTVVNDLSGAPKLPGTKDFFGKVYAFNVPTAKTFPKGMVTVETAEKPPTGAQIAWFGINANDWQLLDTKISGSTLTSEAPGAGIFSVLINKAQ